MRVLAIAPHPDDETLGCGGTLLRHQAAGDRISWLIVTQADESQFTAEVRKRKEIEIEKIAKAYGFEHVLRLKLPTIQN
jgi:LmbE family N-acetylglucosaminyl deacetylase